MTTLQGKLGISAFSSVLFLVVNLPQTYELTNKILPFETVKNGCPTVAGLIVHALVFYLLSFLSMGNKVDEATKAKHALWGTVIFVLLSSPLMYTITGKVFGVGISSGGCPTLMGVLLHAIVYCAVLVGVMYLPN